MPRPVRAASSLSSAFNDAGISAEICDMWVPRRYVIVREGRNWSPIVLLADWKWRTSFFQNCCVDLFNSLPTFRSHASGWIDQLDLFSLFGIVTPWPNLP